MLLEDHFRKLDRAALWQVAAVGPEQGFDQHELVVEGLVVPRAVQSGSERSLAVLTPSKLC